MHAAYNPTTATAFSRNNEPAAAADVARVYTWKRSIVGQQSPKPQQIAFDVGTLSYPYTAVLPIELLGLFAANVSQLKGRLQVIQERHLNLVFEVGAAQPIHFDIRAVLQAFPEWLVN